MSKFIEVNQISVGRVKPVFINSDDISLIESDGDGCHIYLRSMAAKWDGGECRWNEKELVRVTNSYEEVKEMLTERPVKTKTYPGIMG